MKQEDFERLFNAAYQSVKDEQHGLIGVLHTIESGNEALFEYFKRRDNKATCKPHVIAFFNAHGNAAICGKCWRVLDGLPIMVRDTNFEHRRRKRSRKYRRMKYPNKPKQQPLLWFNKVPVFL